MSSYAGLDTLAGTFAGRIANAFLGPDPSAPGAGHAAEPDVTPPIGQSIADFGHGVQQEGLAGLFDIAGMMDRQDAQRALAGQFQVASAEDIAKRGDPAGNVVTPEEFQKVARTYSDIRLGRSDINIDTSNITDPKAQRAFEDDTMRDIGNILQTQVGRDMIGDLAYQKQDHKTRITQNQTAAGAVDTSNAIGGKDPTATTGFINDNVGMDAEVKYVPGDAGGIRTTSKQAWMPMRSDITLFHELAHAFHATTGTYDDNTLTDDELVDRHDKKQGTAEYQAVGLGIYAGSTGNKEDRYVENEYRKERAKIGASGVGTRDTGGVADADVKQRTRYTW